MTGGAKAHRFDRLVNPIAVKELRQAVRGRFVVATLTLCLSAYVMAIGFFVLTQQFDRSAVERAALGPSAFMTLYMVLLTACVFLIPLYAALRMMSERSDTNVDLLFITTIRPRTIILGKLQAAAVLALLLFSSTLPFLMFSYVLRGIDFLSILMLCAFAFAVVMSQTVLALFIGCLPSSKPFKFVLGLVLFSLTMGLYWSVAMISNQLLRSGGAVLVAGGPEMAMIVAVLGALVLLDTVLLFLSIALVTPTTANRALPLRILLTVIWAVSLGIAAWAAFRAAFVGPLTVWTIAALAAACLVLISAVGEREEWGPRVARTIPSQPPLRILAFLFYSGGGGVLWAIVMMISTVSVYATIAPEVATYRMPDVGLRVRWMIDGCVGIVAYAFTALLIRRTLFNGRIPARNTWVVTLVLFLFGAVIPPIVCMAFFSNDPDFNELFRIATFANPFPMTDSVERPARSIVLLFWALAVVLANMRWLADLLERFRRAPVRVRAGAELAVQ